MGRVTHDEIRANLLAAMDGTLDPDTLDEIERHMAECAPCRTEQVELHRMRRSMDREEEAREPKRSRSPWGLLGGGGMMRMLLIAAFMGTALWTVTRRLGNAPGRASRDAAAHVSTRGEGVAAGPPGRLSPVVRDRVLAPGDEVAVPRGVLAVVSLGEGRSLVLEGPAAGDYAGEGRWRHRSGRLLAEAPSGSLGLSVGASSTLRLRSGLAAVWEGGAEEGLRVLLLDAAGVWEGGESAPAGSSWALTPGALSPERADSGTPGWVDALRGALIESGATVVPGVTLIPEGS